MSLFKLFLAADIGKNRLFNLINSFGNAQTVLDASKAELMSIDGIGERIADGILNISSSGKAEKELETARNNGIRIIFFDDEDYPQQLKDYDDMPLFLYIKGTLKPGDLQSVSIVGARRATTYGKTITTEFANYFAQRNITIISGLARGIDTEAHITAVKNNARTIAVLGNGLMVNYPPENTILQAKIPENGAVISEFPLFRQPDKTSFPRRNRIIAALSKATLVVEAASGSGALITARYCAEYGKDVFAVPGSIYSDYSKGTNALIKDGAYLALSPESMAEQLSLLPLKEEEPPQPPKKTYSISLDEMEQAVFELVTAHDEGIHADTIAEQLSIDISRIAAIILKLEINGLIKTLPGQLYARVR